MPIVDIIDGMALGSGVDLGGQIFGDPVVRTESVRDASGQTTDIFLNLVESQEDQDRALNISAEASAAFGLFGGGAKFNLSQAVHFHQFAVTLVIRATVFNSLQQMRDVQLKPDAADLLRNGQPDRFRQEFGDMFVRGLRTGGEFCAILQIIGRDQSDQSAIKGDFLAGGILGAVAVETQDSISSIVTRATTNREKMFRHIQLGGVQTASLDPNEMAKHALDFASGVNDSNSVAFAALILPFTTIDLPTAPNFIDIQAAKDDLAIIMQQRRDTLSRLTAFQFVRSHPEQFRIPATMNLNNIIGRFESAFTALNSAASKCVNKPLEANDALRSVTSLDIPSDNFPTRTQGSGAPDLGAFQGTWQNTNAQGKISIMIIIPTDATHANVRANYTGFSGDFVSTAEFDNATSALKGEVRLSSPPPHGGDAVSPVSSSYQLIKGATPGTLVVTNAQGPIFPADAHPTSTDIFQRTGA